MDMILLAAGSSSRFGENKLLYKIGGKPMYLHAVERALSLQRKGLLGRVVLVTQFDRVEKEASELGAEIVRNERPELGISRSVRLGLDYLLENDPEVESCIFGVCDQPYLRSETVADLIALYRKSGKGMAACAAGEEIGNPVIFSKKYFPELRALSGDVGGKQVLRQHRDDAALLQTDMWELKDLDLRPEPYFYRMEEKQLSRAGAAAEVFPFLADEKNHVISLVGGGGKSSLMDFLAQEFLRRGRRTVKTTTTHILCPEAPEFVPVQNLGLEAMRSRLKEGLPVTVGTPEVRINADGQEVRKLTSLSPLLLAATIEAADATIIEADGARRQPIKVPAEHEPVIHPATDIVIAVLGMDAVGRPLRDVCFRAERAAALLGVDTEHGVAPEDLAKLFLSNRGCRKNVGERDYYCVINQCDSAERLQAASRALCKLEENRCAGGIASALRPEPETEGA